MEQAATLSKTVGWVYGWEMLQRRAVKFSRWEGAELIIESWMRAGEREMHFRDCWSRSPDAQRLTMEHRDDDLAGQLTILDRANDNS